jgi:radical SAM protein with 4Fe4S-binding SPASM domain
MRQESRKTLFRRMAGAHTPVRVQIEATRRCNLNCAHCMVINSAGQAGAPGLSLERFTHLLDELRRSGAFHINLTGGEPLCRPDATDMIRAVLDAGFLLTLQTNGTLLEAAHADMLAHSANRVRQVGVSLYSMDPAVHDAVTRTPGSHERTLRAISLLKSRGLPVVVVTALTRLNAASFEQVESFCRGNGLMFQYNTLITPQDDGGRAPLDLRLDDRLLCRLPKPWETFMDEDRMPASGELTPDSPLSSWCSMGATACYITASGDVRPCSVVSAPAGNLNQQSFEHIWAHSPLFKKLRAFKLSDFECFGCEHFPKCHPCPGLAFLEHGEFTAPPREVCRINSVFFKKQEAAT